MVLVKCFACQLLETFLSWFGAGCEEWLLKCDTNIVRKHATWFLSETPHVSHITKLVVHNLHHYTNVLSIPLVIKVWLVRIGLQLVVRVEKIRNIKYNLQLSIWKQSTRMDDNACAYKKTIWHAPIYKSPWSHSLYPSPFNPLASLSTLILVLIVLVMAVIIIYHAWEVLDLLLSF